MTQAKLMNEFNTGTHCAVTGTFADSPIVDTLVSAGFQRELAQWINTTMSRGNYSHYSVWMKSRESHTVLLIDTFRLEPWYHSVTEETGVVPHGSCQEYTLGSVGTWELGCLDWYGS